VGGEGDPRNARGGMSTIGLGIPSKNREGWTSQAQAVTKSEQDSVSSSGGEPGVLAVATSCGRETAVSTFRPSLFSSASSFPPE
jgi:hypothetical protein